MYSTLKWSDNFQGCHQGWVFPPATWSMTPRYFCRYIEPKKINKKYFIKKEISFGKSKLSNIITAHLWNTQNYPSIQTKCKFHLQQSLAKTKKCQKKTFGLDLVLVHMRENSVCFNRCIGFMLNMLKKQQRNLDSSFTVSQTSSLSNSWYVDLNVCISGTIK